MIEVDIELVFQWVKSFEGSTTSTVHPTKKSKKKSKKKKTKKPKKTTPVPTTSTEYAYYYSEEEENKEETSGQTAYDYYTSTPSNDEYEANYAGYDENSNEEQPEEGVDNSNYYPEEEVEDSNYNPEEEVDDSNYYPASPDYNNDDLQEPFENDGDKANTFIDDLFKDVTDEDVQGTSSGDTEDAEIAYEYSMNRSIFFIFLGFGV